MTERTSRRLWLLIPATVAALFLTAGSCGGSQQPAPTPTVHPGAFCDEPGEQGVTKSGTRMECKGPGDLRWRQP